jgi:hypothetical protein
MPEAPEHQDWFEVAAYTALVDAEAAASALEAAEIDVHLRNTAAVGVLPHMSQAFGGVRVCVPAADLERAREILTTLALPAPEDSANPEDADADPEALAEEENARTHYARRAWRAAILGMVFLPVLLHILSTWNLVRLAWTPGRMSRRAWRMTIGALAVNIIVFTGVGLLVAAALHPPPRRPRIVYPDDAAGYPDPVWVTHPPRDRPRR